MNVNNDGNVNTNGNNVNNENVGVRPHCFFVGNSLYAELSVLLKQRNQIPA